MTINYKNYLTPNVTTNTVVYNPTISGVQATVIGLIICNTTTAVASATVTLTAGITTTNIIYNVQIPPGTSLNVIDANRIIVAINNTLSVTSTQSVDITISAIEVSP